MKRTRLTTFPSYAEAVVLVQGIVTTKEYSKKRVSLGLPSNPDKYYIGKGWSSWQDFLGRVLPRNRFQPLDHMPYEKAKALVQKHRVVNSHHYSKLRAELPELPSDPAAVYAEWGGWRAFLGEHCNINNNVFVSYKKAKEIVQLHRVSNRRDFYAILPIMRRLRVPTHPNLYYKQWRGWNGFLSGQKNKTNVRCTIPSYVTSLHVRA